MIHVRPKAACFLGTLTLVKKSDVIAFHPVRMGQAELLTFLCNVTRGAFNKTSLAGFVFSVLYEREHGVS